MDIMCSVSVSAIISGGGGTGASIDWRGYQASYDGGTAGDVYVSPTGSDANPGTLAAPKLTIAAAVLANPGKAVKLRGGIYRQHVVLGAAASGTAAAPTIISRYGAEEPIISAREVLTGLTACTSADAAIVGARWPNIYKVTLADSALASTNPLGLTPVEAGRMMPLASELVLSPRTPVEPYGIEDWPEWEVIQSASKITGYRNAAITAKYSRAQVEAMTVCFYGSPNLAYTTEIASFDSASGIIALVNQGQSYGSGIYKNRMSLKNCVSEIRQGQWACRPNGNGTTTYYLWLMDPANAAGGVEYSARLSCLDFAEADHVHIKGLVIEGTGGSNSGQKDAGQPLVKRFTGANIQAWNCLIRQHWRIGEREVFGVLMQEVDDFEMHDCTVSECWGMYGIHPQGKAVGVTSMAQKTKGLWINRLVCEDISSSAIRIYQMTYGAVTHYLAKRNVGVSPHANVFDPKRKSHYILAHGCDFSASAGYITYQEASAVHLTYCYAKGNPKGDDKRVLWDQSLPGDSPAAEFGIPGGCSWMNLHLAPDVQDLTAWNAIRGGISSEVPVEIDNSVLFNPMNELINANVTRGSRNVIPQGTAVSGEITEPRDTTYENITAGDFRLKAGSAARTTRGNSKASARAAFLSNLPFLPAAVLDLDINGAAVDWSGPPIGPAESGNLTSGAEHFISLPVLTGGTVAVGQTLTMDDGVRTPADVPVTYQWVQSVDGGYSWAAISGATDASYTIPAGTTGRRFGRRTRLRGNTVTTYVEGAVA